LSRGENQTDEFGLIPCVRSIRGAPLLLGACGMPQSDIHALAHMLPLLSAPAKRRALLLSEAAIDDIANI
jgi:hypothetical protein